MKTQLEQNEALVEKEQALRQKLVLELEEVGAGGEGGNEAALLERGLGLRASASGEWPRNAGAVRPATRQWLCNPPTAEGQPPGPCCVGQGAGGAHWCRLVWC